MTLLGAIQLLQSAALTAAQGDTVLVRQLPPARTAFEQLVFVASGITTLLTLVLLLAVLLAVVALKRQAEETRVRMDALLSELQPLAKNANQMLAESRETVTQANLRIRHTVDSLADQVDQVTEMLGKINRSANRVATVASTAVAGLKLGAKAFGFGGKKKRRSLDREDERAERPKLRRRG
jgi:uncharacterized protein YoxC